MDSFKEAPLVSISDAQRRPLKRANFVGTVHHGLPVGLLTPQAMAREYLAFLGRICPEKGARPGDPHRQGAGMKLKIAAKVDRSIASISRATISSADRRPRRSR